MTNPDLTQAEPYTAAGASIVLYVSGSSTLIYLPHPAPLHVRAACIL